jgi:hypothetical protein
MSKIFVWEARTFHDLLRVDRSPCNIVSNLNKIIELAFKEGVMGDLYVPRDEAWAEGTDRDRLEWSPLRFLRSSAFYPFLFLIRIHAKSGDECVEFLKFGNTVFGEGFRYLDDGLPGGIDSEDYDLEQGLSVVLRDPHGDGPSERDRQLLKELGWWSEDDEQEFSR